MADTQIAYRSNAAFCYLGIIVHVWSERMMFTGLFFDPTLKEVFHHTS